MGLSLNPGKADSGGGFLNDVVVEIINPIFKITTYGGQVRETTVLELTFVNTENGEPYNPQFFSCGNAEHRVPSLDGKTPAKGKEGPYLVATKEGLEGLPKNSHGNEFMTSLVDAGYPMAKLEDGNISKIAGTVIRVGQVPTKGIDGKVQKTRSKKDGKEYDKTHPICTALISLPNEGKAQSATQSAVSAAASEDDQTAAQMLVASLAAENGELKKAMIASKGLQALKAEGAMDQPSMQRVIKLAMSNDFLEAGSKDGLWSFDQGVVKSV